MGAARRLRVASNRLSMARARSIPRETGSTTFSPTHSAPRRADRYMSQAVRIRSPPVSTWVISIVMLPLISRYIRLAAGSGASAQASHSAGNVDELTSALVNCWIVIIGCPSGNRGCTMLGTKRSAP